jgi:hypothetical protein
VKNWSKHSYYTVRIGMNIVIKQHRDSLERIEFNGQFVYVVGKGLMKSPGHPAGNQLFHRQNEYLRVGSTPPYLFSVFYQDIQGDVKHLGEYTIHTICKRNSFEGFSYYEFKLIRRFKARLELPNLPTLQHSLLVAADAVNNERE